jgi:hypothetical protein
VSERETSFAAAGLRRITVHLSRGTVTVQRIHGENVTIQASEPVEVARTDDELLVGSEGAGKASWLHGDLGKLKVRFGEGDRADTEGSWLNLATLGSQISDAVTGALRGLLGSDVVIGIPAVLEYPTLRVTTGLGDVRASQVTADWSIHSGLGDIELLRCSGGLSAQSGKGDVRVEEFGGRVSCTTGAGEIRLHQLAGRLEARTGAGDVLVSGALDGGDVHSGAGDLRAEGVAGDWTLRSGQGDLLVRVGPQGGALTMRTGSGDIRVEGDALRDLRAQTASGDVLCESVLVGGPHELVTQNGDIVLVLGDPPGARLQILTGYGDVVSDYPLVRVGRQGPPTANGARYVGNVGDSAVEIVLRTAHGDVRVRRRPEEPGALAQTARPATSSFGETPGTGMAGAAAQTETYPSASVAVQQPQDIRTNADASGLARDPQDGMAPQDPRTSARLRVLQSLQRGEISAQEAAILLDSLN